MCSCICLFLITLSWLDRLSAWTRPWKAFLLLFVNACPQKWLQWIYLVEYWYNTSHHSAIGRSPFEALYGYSPKNFDADVDMAVSSSDLDSWLQQKRVINALIKQQLFRSHERTKKNKQTKVVLSIRSMWIWFLSNFNHMCSHLWLHVLIKSLASSFSVHSRCWRVLVKWLTRCCYQTLHSFTQYSTSRNWNKWQIPLRCGISMHSFWSDLTKCSREFILQCRMVTRGLHEVQQGLVGWSRLPHAISKNPFQTVQVSSKAYDVLDIYDDL